MINNSWKWGKLNCGQRERGTRWPLTVGGWLATGTVWLISRRCASQCARSATVRRHGCCSFRRICARLALVLPAFFPRGCLPVLSRSGLESWLEWTGYGGNGLARGTDPQCTLSFIHRPPWTPRDKRLRISRSSFPWLIILCLFLARLNPSLLKSFSMVLLYSTLSFEIHNIRSITILLYTIGLFISQILCLLFK